MISVSKLNFEIFPVIKIADSWLWLVQTLLQVRLCVSALFDRLHHLRMQLRLVRGLQWSGSRRLYFLPATAVVGFYIFVNVVGRVFGCEMVSVFQVAKAL